MRNALIASLSFFILWIIAAATFGFGSESADNIADFQCPAGQFVIGFKSGKPTCGIVKLPAMATQPRGYGN